MRHTNDPYLEKLLKLLPFISSLSSPTDLPLRIAEFRRLYQEAPDEVDRAYGRAIEIIRTTRSPDLAQNIDDTMGPILAAMPISIEEDGAVATLYAAGFFAYGLTNSPLRTEKLTEEKAEAFRDILYKHYFDKRSCEIVIYERLVPLNHRITSESAVSYDFLRMLASSETAFVRINTSLDMPGYDCNYDEEDESSITERFRLILFAVKTKKNPTRPALTQSYEAQNFLVRNDAEEIFFSPDYLLKRPYGIAFKNWCESFAGELRFYVTEPYLLDDTVRQLDYVVGLKRVLIQYMRTCYDEGLSDTSSLIVSFGVFSDPVKDYSELRVGFALNSRPNDLIAGVPLPLPPVDSDAAGDELIHYARAILSDAGIATPDPANYPHLSFVAEPDSVDRLYNTVAGIQKPLQKKVHVPGRSDLMFN